MPELPEVETIRRSLLRRVPGRRIHSVEVRERRLRRPLAMDFENRLRDRRIEGVRRRGKYLLFDLDDATVLLVHLGMSGSLIVRPSSAPVEPHDHVLLGLDGRIQLVLNDPRRFGLMRAGVLDELIELRTVGRDPLAEPWAAAELRDQLRRRRLPIKSFLMDQRCIAGIGNIYANELLFRAGIRPRRRADRLLRHEVETLLAAMHDVLTEAVRLGGSSISDFRDGSGRPGYFQLRLAVYDRAGEPCRRCTTPIKRLLLSGRSTFYCPACQR